MPLLQLRTLNSRRLPSGSQRNLPCAQSLPNPLPNQNFLTSDSLAIPLECCRAHSNVTTDKGELFLSVYVVDESDRIDEEPSWQFDEGSVEEAFRHR
jgi:hypothetical protein